MADKKDHFVPQFYLKKFANLHKDIYKIWIFDKKEFVLKTKNSDNPYYSNVDDTATIKYFYEFPGEIVGEANKKAFDADLKKNEDVIAPFIKKFENKLFYILKSHVQQQYQSKVIKKKEKKFWANILSIQVLRTPELRDLLNEVRQKAENEKVTQDFLIEKTREYTDYIQTVIDDYNQKEFQKLLVDRTNEITDEIYNKKKIMSVLHNVFFEKYRMELSKVFLKHKWMIGINQTNVPFYTSDNPVVKIPYFETGYSSKGIEIVFPLNPEVILILREKTHIKSNEGDCKLLNLSNEEVLEYNKAQIYCSNRFIYCREDNFDLAKEICKENPDFCCGLKNRVEVIK